MSRACVLGFYQGSLAALPVGAWLLLHSEGGWVGPLMLVQGAFALFAWGYQFRFALTPIRAERKQWQRTWDERVRHNGGRPGPLWLQFQDCHEDPASGIVTARGTLMWGGRPDKIQELSKDWHPPFEAQISANGRDITVIVTQVEITYGSRDIVWHAQDKASFMSAHRVVL